MSSYAGLPQWGGALIGRGEDLELIRSLVHEAAARGGALLLSGQPGVGKTMLLDAITAAASAIGTRLLRGALILWILSGLGKIIVGLVLENTHIGLHLLGALNVSLGSIAILAIRRSHHGLGIIGIVVAAVGLASSFLSTAGQYADPSAYLGLGAGSVERLASYPDSLWMPLIGMTAMFSPASSRAADQTLEHGNRSNSKGYRHVYS